MAGRSSASSRSSNRRNGRSRCGDTLDLELAGGWTDPLAGADPPTKLTQGMCWSGLPIFQPPIHPNLFAIHLKMHDKTDFPRYYLLWEVCIVIKTKLSIPDTQ